jgi:hypothetical protein
MKNGAVGDSGGEVRGNRVMPNCGVRIGSFRLTIRPLRTGLFLCTPVQAVTYDELGQPVARHIGWTLLLWCYQVNLLRW